MLKKIGRIVLVSVLYYGWHIPMDVTAASAQTDAVQARFVGSGVDAGSFPITTGITHVDLKTNGVEVQFSKRDGASRWPNTCGRPFADPGDDCKEVGFDMGPLQYSLGLAVKVNGEWVASAPVETWFGNNTIAGQVQDQSVSCPSGGGQIHCNLFYDGRWAPLDQSHPNPGEQIGVYVVAGDARNNFFIVKERSNIVLVTLPNTGVSASFDYAVTPPAAADVNESLHRLRAKYGAHMSAVEFGKLLNEIAWEHRADGYVLLGKNGGNVCPSPAGPTVSCDFIVNASTKHGWDILSDAGDGGAGNPVDQSGDGADLSDAIANGSRSLVAPVDPGTGPSTCQDPKANNIGQPLPCTFDTTEKGPKGDKGDPGPKGDKGDPGDAVNVAALQAQIDALKAQINSFKIPTGCKAQINLGATKITIHCELTY